MPRPPIERAVAGVPRSHAVQARRRPRPRARAAAARRRRARGHPPRRSRGSEPRAGRRGHGRFATDRRPRSRTRPRQGRRSPRGRQSDPDRRWAVPRGASAAALLCLPGALGRRRRDAASRRLAPGVARPTWESAGAPRPLRAGRAAGGRRRAAAVARPRRRSRPPGGGDGRGRMPRDDRTDSTSTNRWENETHD